MFGATHDALTAFWSMVFSSPCVTLNTPDPNSALRAQLFPNGITITPAGSGCWRAILRHPEGPVDSRPSNVAELNMRQSLEYVMESRRVTKTVSFQCPGGRVETYHGFTSAGDAHLDVHGSLHAGFFGSRQRHMHLVSVSGKPMSADQMCCALREFAKANREYVDDFKLTSQPIGNCGWARLWNFLGWEHKPTVILSDSDVNALCEAYKQDDISFDQKPAFLAQATITGFVKQILWALLCMMITQVMIPLVSSHKGCQRLTEKYKFWIDWLAPIFNVLMFMLLTPLVFTSYLLHGVTALLNYFKPSRFFAALGVSEIPEYVPTVLSAILALVQEIGTGEFATAFGAEVAVLFSWVSVQAVATVLFNRFMPTLKLD